MTAIVDPVSSGRSQTSETLDEFVARARAFLEEHAVRKPDTAAEFVWGEGDDFVGIVEEGDPAGEAQLVAAERKWAATRFDAGFSLLYSPSHLGG